MQKKEKRLKKITQKLKIEILQSIATTTTTITINIYRIEFLLVCFSLNWNFFFRDCKNSIEIIYIYMREFLFY